LSDFQFLTPSKNAEKIKVYCDALHEALEHEDVKNIAISGSYGAGKSSFIKTFEYKNKDSKYKFLDISLAAFKKEDKDISLVEKSILQQIFYKVEQGDVPRSRFKRINTVSWLKSKSFFVVLFALSFLVFFDSKYVNFLYYPNDLKFLPLIIVIIGVYVFFKSIIQNFTGVTLEKLNLQNLEIKTNKEDEASLLNKYLDEILYFFSNTSYNTVVFQDLDRFDNIEIFTKLRELNNFLNNSEQVKKKHKKIVFLYAIKDDMFKDGDARTKFFDFMIPIIPYINSSTSYDKLLEFFKDDLASNKKFTKENEKTKFEDFLRDISLYIKDMRLLKNIYNEYKIYDEKIGDKLDKTKLLGIVVYKNFYPEDFNMLHKDEGMVFNIFKNKNRYIKELDNRYNQEIKNLTTQIKDIENEQHSDIQELRIVYIYKIIQKLGSLTQNQISIDNKTINISHAILDDNFKLIQLSQNIRINHYQGFKFSDIEKEVNKKSYSDRETFILEKFNGTIKERYQKIEAIKDKQKLFQRQSIKQLCTLAHTKNLLSRYLKKKELLQYLIFNGHLEENYYLYLSYSFNKSLTSSDTEFLKNVVNNNNLDFDYKLTNLKELMNKLRVNEFEKYSILNYDLIDFLINNKTDYKEQYEAAFELLTNESEESIKFIFAYIDFLPEMNLFISEISRHWAGVWQYFYDDAPISHRNLEKYFYLFLYNLNTEQLVKINENNTLAKFISNLSSLKDLTMEDNEKFQQLISALDIKFYNLVESISNKPLFAYIYENNNYVLNQLMIEQIIYTKYVVKSDIEEDLHTKYLTTIKVLDQHKKLIQNIENNISLYINDIFLQIKSNRNESEETIIWLLNNDKLNLEEKTKIIDKQDTIIEDISKIAEQEVLDILFEKNKIKPVWENIGWYYNLTKLLNNVLINYLNIEKTAKELSKIKINANYCDEHKSFNTQILEDILVSNSFDINSYKMLIKANGYLYKLLDISNLNEDRVDVLIDEGKLQLTTENIKNLKEHLPLKYLTLIEKQIDIFIKNFDEFANLLCYEDFIKLFKSKNILDKNKFDLLDCIKFESFTINEKLALILSELYFKNKKRMNKNLLTSVISQLLINNKLEFLVFQLAFKDEEFECNEINELLSFIGSPYSELCMIGAYMNIDNNQNNKTLIEILDDKNCISSHRIENKKIRVNRFRK